MAYELLNSAQVTPARVYAMLRLIAYLQYPTREAVQSTLQPTVLFNKKAENTSLNDNLEDEISQRDEQQGSPSQSASSNVYIAMRHCRLIEELSDSTIHLPEDVVSHVGSLEQFRIRMQERVWNAINPDQPNYLFNFYSAWYVVQNERVFQFVDKDVETFYNRDLQTDDIDDVQRFNTTKFNGWRMWASFLGLGKTIKPGLIGNGREFLIPDASNRLRGVLNQIFAMSGQTLTINQFLNNLASTCPELDGGLLFLQCRDASRGSEQYGDYLSLALSTGLRTLHYAGEIELVRQADATDTRQLYPGEGHPQNLKEVTHIRLMEQQKHGK